MTPKQAETQSQALQAAENRAQATEAANEPTEREREREALARLVDPHVKRTHSLALCNIKDTGRCCEACVEDPIVIAAIEYRGWEYFNISITFAKTTDITL